MKRRNFLKSTALATPLVGLTSIKGLADRYHDGAAFKMKYAPHFGMFKNSAGGDLVDQLKFMADNGSRQPGMSPVIISMFGISVNWKPEADYTSCRKMPYQLRILTLIQNLPLLLLH